jgi:hypothetical protein
MTDADTDFDMTGDDSPAGAPTGRAGMLVRPANGFQPAVYAGDFQNGQGLLGIRWGPGPFFRSSDPLQIANTAVNGVPITDDANSINGTPASQQADFMTAYRADARTMRRPTADDPADSYYLQGVSDGIHAGAQESYAESFARYVARDPKLDTRWPNMYRYWEAQDALHGLRQASSP